MIARSLLIAALLFTASVSSAVAQSRSDVIAQPTLRAFLDARAAAFLSNNYYDSDVAWMKLDASIEPTIGPYEVYEDEWFNYKAAFEAFITVRDDEETGKLDVAVYKEKMGYDRAMLKQRLASAAQRTKEKVASLRDKMKSSSGDEKANLEKTVAELENQVKELEDHHSQLDGAAEEKLAQLQERINKLLAAHEKPPPKDGDK